MATEPLFQGLRQHRRVRWTSYSPPPLSPWYKESIGCLELNYVSLTSGHTIGPGIEAQPKAASHRLKRPAGCGASCCPIESRDLVSWLVGPIKSSPLWVPGRRVHASRQAEERWKSRDSEEPWDSRRAGTIEKAVGGNGRRQKTGSQECQNLEPLWLLKVTPVLQLSTYMSPHRHTIHTPPWRVFAP